MKLVPLFEAVIRPHDFEDAISRLKQTHPIESIDHLESLFDGKVRFISLKQYKKLRPEASLPFGVELTITQGGGIGAGTVIDGLTYIICDPKLLVQNLNSYWRKRLIDYLWTVIRHETIHIQQIDRSGGKFADVDQAGTPDQFKSYLANKQELMAYAQTVVDDLKTKYGLSNKDILRRIQGKGGGSEYFARYLTIFKEDPKVMNRLRKYIYQYLQDEEPLNEQHISAEKKLPYIRKKYMEHGALHPPGFSIIMVEDITIDGDGDILFTLSWETAYLYEDVVDEIDKLEDEVEKYFGETISWDFKPEEDEGDY